MKTPYIHIYGQSMNHDDLFIIGNKEGLIALSDALDMVSAHWNDDSIGVDVFAKDGEGYKIIIKRANDDEMEQLMLPYTEGYANWKGKSPVELIGVDVYKKLFGR